MTKAESNRLNSRRSTGPKTPAGKDTVSKNAVKHGAYSEALTMLLERPEDFDTMKAGMMTTFRPVGPMETHLVDRMASLWWRMERTKNVANQALWIGARCHLQGTIQAFMDDMDPFQEGIAMDRDECRLPAAWDDGRQERLLRHELTLERSFFKTLHEFERLQAMGLGQAVPLPMALDLNITGDRD